MLATHAVGIDLGTTYSCLAYLNEHGEPVTIPNQEGELSTPSAVLFENGDAIVGTEALRNAIVHPDRVVQNAKRFMGDPDQRWKIDGRVYTPSDIASLILKKLLNSAEQQIGPVERAVITVPAQFSDVQRQVTVEAGLKAGLAHVDIINEPVAAALCYVLGTEGLWFTELANAQTILVYDLGGGTFDLSLVSYEQNRVKVIASSGDLNLGGIDWNQALVNAIASSFAREFGVDPREDPESLQYLSWEVEQTKRSLSARPRAALSCQHHGHRKTYQVEQSKFASLTEPLLHRTQEITRQLLKDNHLGWAHIDVVLTTGGSSRMPMVRDMLKQLSGRTLNTSLSPDQSIAHGATYYAGMLLTNNEFVHSILNPDATSRLSKIQQQSVNARGLGILIRNTKTNGRTPHYLIPANTPLPVAITHTFGTVIPNQRRVHLHIVESGARPELPHVELGTCIIEDLPPNLPMDSEIAVTISYDVSARVHVSAVHVKSGRQTTTEIVRAENLSQLGVTETADSDVLLKERIVAESSRKTAATPPEIGPSSTEEPAPASGSAGSPAKGQQKESGTKVAAKSATAKPTIRAIPRPPALQGDEGEKAKSRPQSSLDQLNDSEILELPLSKSGKKPSSGPRANGTVPPGK